MLRTVGLTFATQGARRDQVQSTCVRSREKIRCRGRAADAREQEKRQRRRLAVTRRPESCLSFGNIDVRGARRVQRRASLPVGASAETAPRPFPKPARGLPPLSVRRHARRRRVRPCEGSRRSDAGLRRLKPSCWVMTQSSSRSLGSNGRGPTSAASERSSVEYK